MKLSGKVISSLLIFSLVSGNVAAGTVNPETNGKTDPLAHLFDFEKQAFQKTYASLPPDIRAFERLDFDSRMERQEYLRLIYGDQLFVDTLRRHLLKQDKSIEAVMMAMEIVSLGRPVALLKPDSSIQNIAEICGLKRLYAMINSEKEQNFWQDKNRLYREGLLAEMRALDEAGSLFNVYELMRLKRTVLSGCEKTSSGMLSASYHEIILNRAQKRLNQDQQFYAHRSLSDQIQ